MGRGEIIAENLERHLQGSRLHIDRTEGHGNFEFYRLNHDLYVVTADGVFDAPRVETVPGEGLVEFHLRLSGVLELVAPGWAKPLTVTGPRLLIIYQPPGVEVSERVMAMRQESCVSLYIGRELLAEFARGNGVSGWPLLGEINEHRPDSVWYRLSELSPTLLYIGTSLLESPYRGGLRLLHAEAKAIELLCDVLAAAQEQDTPGATMVSQGEIRQLEAARRMVAANISTPVRIRDISRAVGMSESKLKRTFKARYGVTIFTYGLERRMRHALELLRCKRMAVGQVAYAVGYRHQTSFATAFQDFFGFLPSKARTEMH